MRDLPQPHSYIKRLQPQPKLGWVIEVRKSGICLVEDCASPQDPRTRLLLTMRDLADWEPVVALVE